MSLCLNSHHPKIVEVLSETDVRTMSRRILRLSLFMHFQRFIAKPNSMYHAESMIVLLFVAKIADHELEL